MEDKDVSLPDGIKNLRACLRCHLIKTTEQVNFSNLKRSPNPLLSKQSLKKKDAIIAIFFKTIIFIHIQQLVLKGINFLQTIFFELKKDFWALQNLEKVGWQNGLI